MDKNNKDNNEYMYEKDSYIINNIENEDKILMENTAFNGKSALEYVKYLLNDSNNNDKINYSELREELDTSTFGGDTFNKKLFKKKDDKELVNNYFNEKDNLNTKDVDNTTIDNIPPEYNEIDTYKNNIIQLKKELLEAKNKNEILQEENFQLKESLQKANILNEEKRKIDEGYDIDSQLKLNPEQQITLEKLQELMIQLSKKIEKLKNDNETLKKRVILSNNESKFNSIIKNGNNPTNNVINILTDEECRHMLSYICKHLKINDFTNIETNLRNVELTIKSVPHMQKFITDIDDLVWKSQDDEKIHKLSETLNEIKKLIKSKNPAE